MSENPFNPYWKSPDGRPWREHARPEQLTELKRREADPNWEAKHAAGARKTQRQIADWMDEDLKREGPTRRGGLERGD